MDTWVVCPRCLIAWQGQPGETCPECGGKSVKAPLQQVKKPVDISRDSRTRLCPYCRVHNVLHTYPGGFKSCADQACKNAALDAAMEAE